METITASLKIDSRQAEQKLETVREKIARLEKDIGERKEKQADLNAEADRLSQEYQKALDKLEELKRLQNDSSISGFTSRGAGFEKEIAAQEKVVAAAEKNYGKARQAAEKYYDYTTKKEEDLKFAQEHAGQIAQQMEAAKSPAALLAKRTGEIKDNTDRIFNRIKGLFRRVLFFSVIAKGIRMIRDYIMEVVKVNPQATEAIARLKGSLLTLAQPIIEVVVPALIKLINAITWVINRITAFFATLSGKTIGKVSENAKALYDQTKALNATGKAAKDAKKQLAGFDELNILSDKESGGGSSSTDIEPIFDNSDLYISNLERILEIIKSIAAVLAGFKIAKWLGFSTPMSLAIAAIGLLLLKVMEYGETLDDFFGGLKQMLGGFLDFFAGDFSGGIHNVIQGLLTMDLAIIQGFFNSVKKFIDNLREKVNGLADGTKTVVKGAINYIITCLNILIAGINAMLLPMRSVVAVIGKVAGRNATLQNVKIPSIPKLAQGTIVPPNREFLAMLGDNKTEQEVVSPLSTMKQAFLEAMRESGGGDRPVNIYLDGKLLATTTTKYQNQMAKARG